MTKSDIELLSDCTNFNLSHVHVAEEKVIEELQTSAVTRLVTALRMFRLQRAIFAIGMFSLFESILQDHMNWQEPFGELKKCLEKQGKGVLAKNFDNYRHAINVLKHGKGPSYDRLLEKASELDFSIKPSGEFFFEEGDVSEVTVLIDADDQFVNRCATLIQEAAASVIT